MKQTIVSGIRASGKLHIGNFLGALKQFVDLQDEGSNNCFFFIADLHAITTPFDPKQLTQNTLEVAAEYLAAGIDPKNCTFFLQSQVLEHAELAWIFNCLTPLGELYRMTQFKDKSEGEQKESINAGLLTYPALMAADILIYKPTAVPVGEDQTQHVELTRAIARKFNNRFGKTFPEPKTYLNKPMRIMSLTDPSKKMSKSHDEGLMLDDTPAEILRKLKKAPTATDAHSKSTGVENLFNLLSHFGSKEEISHFKNAQDNNTIKYSELKQTLADRISEFFAEFREKKQILMQNPKKIQDILEGGSVKARKVAQTTLVEVKQKIGLI